MPRFSVWSIRIAMGYLVTGFLLGAVLLINKGIPLHPLFWAILPAHIEFLLMGWVLQFVFGIAYWILPRLRNEPKRGITPLAWVALGLLNVGIWLVSLPNAWLGQPLYLVGRLAELGAAVVFLIYAWPRIRAFQEKNP